MSKSPDPLSSALSLYRVGRLEEALLICTEALSQQRYCGALALFQGRLLLEGEQTDEAVEVLRALVVREPEHWTAAWYLGAAEILRENWAEAEAALATVLDHQPDHALGLALPRSLCRTAGGTRGGPEGSGLRPA